MKIVIDTNIVFSALLNTDSQIAQLLIMPPKNCNYYAPNFLKTEIKKHQPRIQQIIGTESIDELMDLVFQHIHFIDEALVSEKSVKRAYNLVRDVDPADTSFVALAIHLKALLWTGDKKLIKGLHNQSFKKTLSTQQLYRLY